MREKRDVADQRRILSKLLPAKGWSALRVVTAAAILIAIPIVLWRFGAPDELLILALIAEVCLLLGLLWKKYALYWFGPLFFYEVIRLARQGRNQGIRFAYGLLILAGLWGAFSHHFPTYDLLANPFAPGPTVSREDNVRFSTNFALSILAVQAAAVLFLTPAYLSSCIAEEKEQKTLELLFTTHLLDREIIFGKLFSRLLHLAMILLTSLPILLFLAFWSRLPLSYLLAGFAVCGFSLLSIGGISILLSVQCKQVFTAMIGAYLIIIPVSVLGLMCAPLPLTSPVVYVMSLESAAGGGMLQNLLFGGAMPQRNPPFDPLMILPFYALVHGAIALFCIGPAIAQLRGKALAQLPRQRRADPKRYGERLTGPVRGVSGDAQTANTLGAYRPRAVHLIRTHPVTDQPLLWKERFHQADPFLFSWSFWRIYVVVLTTLAVLAIPPWLTVTAYRLTLAPDVHSPSVEMFDRFYPRGMNFIVRAGTILLAGMWCVMTGLRAAGSITREKEQHTWASLFLLPFSRWQILWSKWAGNIWRYHVFAACLLALWTVGVIVGAIHPLAALLLAVACTIHLIFFANLGVGVSLGSRNSLWANCTMVLMLLLAFMGWWVGLIYAQFFFGVRPSDTSWWNSFIEIGLNPARSWWYFGMGWEDLTGELSSVANLRSGNLSAALAGLGVLALLSIVFCVSSYLQFRKEQPIA